MQAIVFIEAHGKVKTWTRVLTQLGVDADVVATSGHVCNFPDSLFPVGLRFSNGHAIDVERKIKPHIASRLYSKLRGLDENTKIIIATDDDSEGDVIALDIVKVLLDADPGLIDQVIRVRPMTLTKNDIRRALVKAEGSDGGLSDIVDRAVYGRARSFTDRWMGATFSQKAKTSCGRVRAGILGTCFCWTRSPDLVRGIPETGDITFQARSASGGAFFIAHIPFHGSPPEVLVRLAEKYENKILPCVIRPHQSVGAAIAPRFGVIQPFNTGDVLAYAARHHGIEPKIAMKGLQSAYMAGRLSYPRTDNRSLSPEAASHIIQLSRACGISDTSLEHAGLHAHVPNENSYTKHEALYPIVPMSQENLKEFTSLAKRPIRKIDTTDPQEIEDVMVALVSRRSFEAMRRNESMPGRFISEQETPLSKEECAALEELDWVQPISKGLPWSKFQTTGVRYWPVESMIIDGMMMEGIGRPSTYASHVELVMERDQIHIPKPGDLPQLTPQGQSVLRKLPKGIWIPETCRLIEAALMDPAPGENKNGDITSRMRSRINYWFHNISPEIRKSLIDMLKSENGRPQYEAVELQQEAVLSLEAASENFYDFYEDMEPA